MSIFNWENGVRILATMACLFYLFVLLAIAAPTIFVRTIWRDAKKWQWNYITDSSRTMYVDVVKTLITASGIAVALVASASAHALDSLARFSTRVGVISLIICISASFVTMLALIRGHEVARNKSIAAGSSGQEAQLSDSQLLSILIFADIAIASFLVGLLFLGRITFHT
jgi:hypothetical protein